MCGGGAWVDFIDLYLVVWWMGRTIAWTNWFDSMAMVIQMMRDMNK